MIAWRKSSHSGVHNESDCVEVAVLARGVGMRDSKAPQVGHLTLKPQTFADLLARIKTGRLDP
ncbi:DUF397 domain-containing protein [Actinomadura rugatobispora]|uniref:DUF397 domain-containing protein n=1 Tax=Actinomadura rugatobispora TaxID=1994 RepID=A0ABW1AAF7_9ACTN|nr:DUF397 domain-containing protein [Actinomadura rugatobispora]